MALPMHVLLYKCAFCYNSILKQFKGTPEDTPTFVYHFHDLRLSYGRLLLFGNAESRQHDHRQHWLTPLPPLHTKSSLVPVTRGRHT